MNINSNNNNNTNNNIINIPQPIKKFSSNIKLLKEYLIEKENHTELNNYKINNNKENCILKSIENIDTVINSIFLCWKGNFKEDIDLLLELHFCVKKFLPHLENLPTQKKIKLIKKLIINSCEELVDFNYENPIENKICGKKRKIDTLIFPECKKTSKSLINHFDSFPVQNFNASKFSSINTRILPPILSLISNPTLPPILPSLEVLPMLNDSAIGENNSIQKKKSHRKINAILERKINLINQIRNIGEGNQELAKKMINIAFPKEENPIENNLLSNGFRIKNLTNKISDISREIAKRNDYILNIESNQDLKERIRNFIFEIKAQKKIKLFLDPNEKEAFLNLMLAYPANTESKFARILLPDYDFNNSRPSKFKENLRYFILSAWNICSPNIEESKLKIVILTEDQKENYIRIVRGAMERNGILEKNAKASATFK